MAAKKKKKQRRRGKVRRGTTVVMETTGFGVSSSYVGDVVAFIPAGESAADYLPKGAAPTQIRSGLVSMKNDRYLVEVYRGCGEKKLKAIFRTPLAAHVEVAQQV